jgi:hypothetical protein
MPAQGLVRGDANAEQHRADAAPIVWRALDRKLHALM